jgi:hypothetical protein
MGLRPIPRFWAYLGATSALFGVEFETDTGNGSFESASGF